MEKTYLMAVDLGTSFIKAAVYDTEGTQRALSKAAVNSDSSRPGIFLQSGEEIYQSVLGAMRDAAEMMGGDAEYIAAVGFTGQMAGFMGVGRNWEDITSWSCSLDTRYVPYANAQMAELAEPFLRICGTNAPLMSAKCKWFVTDFPEEAKKVAKYMLISSYVIGRLGRMDIEKAVLGSSYITWTGLADIRTRSWSDELCGASGIRKELLPEIVDYHTVSGHLSEDAARALGLPAGIPLVAGAGDKIAGCIGTGILHPGDTIFEASSYGAVSVLSEDCTPNPVRHDYDAIPALEAGQYYLHKYFPGSGITLKWFLDTFGSGDGQEASEKDPFEQMEEAVRKIPAGSDGLIALGLLGGSAMPFDGEIRGMFAGHTWSHTKAHFYRALLESFAYELAGTMDSIHEVFPGWDRYGDVRIIGGGAASRTWRQILSDVTGCRFLDCSGYDAALWGTAVLAGKGIGLWTDPAEKVLAAQKTGEIAVPDPKDRAVYLKYQKVYDTLAAQMHPLCAQLQEIENEGGSR